MKKTILLHVFLIFTVISSCSKNQDLANFDDKDRSAEVAHIYQGTLTINGTTYDNAKVKVTKTGASKALLEPASGHDYQAFEPIVFSDFLYIRQQQSYISNGLSRTLAFYFENDDKIGAELSYSGNGDTIIFEGSNSK